MNKRLDAYRNVCLLAGAAVLESSRTGASNAYVRRDLLNQIEDALIAAGYDMAAARAKVNAQKKAERKERVAKRDAEIVAKFPPGTKVQVSLYGRTRNSTGTVGDEGTVTAQAARSPYLLVKWDHDEKPTWVSAYDVELTFEARHPSKREKV